MITPDANCPASKDPSHLTITNIGVYTLKGKTYQVCQIQGDILINTTLTNKVIWSLIGRVNVGNGNGILNASTPVTRPTLTITAGTVFRSHVTSSLVVTRGAQINAQGYVGQPIVFWSDNDDDFDDRGMWGGLVLQGFGYENFCGNPAINQYCNIAGEGASGYFGGRNNADNSGIMKYVVIAEAGYAVANANELNGLGLMGVGYHTVIDYVQVHNNLDDGFEMWGGAVNVTHLVSTSNLDDNIDWDEGYVGNLQYIMIAQTIIDTRPGEVSNGFEMDTAGDARQSAWRESNPTVVNASIFSLLDATERAYQAATGKGMALQFKEGSEGQFANTLVMGTWANPMKIQDTNVLTSYISGAGINSAFINVYGNSILNNAIDYGTSGYTITSPKFNSTNVKLSNTMAEADLHIPAKALPLSFGSKEINGTAD